MKKCLLFAAVAAVLSVAMVFGLAGVASATITWDGGGGDNLWNTAANWEPNGVPSGDEVRLYNSVSPGSNVSVVIAENQGGPYLRVGYGATGTATALITQTAGTVNFSSFITMANCGTYKLQGGTLSTGTLYLEFDGGDRDLPSRGTVEVSGGTLSVGSLSWMGYGRDQGRLMIDGGAGIINVGDFQAGATNDLLSLRPDGNNLSPINVTGSASLGQALDVAFTANPTVSTIFTVINKSGSSGYGSTTFQGLAEGATFNAPGIGGNVGLKVSYAGGTGNDVTLQVMSLPVGDLIIEKYWDKSGDGSIAGDPLLPGWTFNVEGIGYFTDTDLDGIVTVSGLTPGDYTVDDLNPPGWVCTYDTDGGTLGTVVATMASGNTTVQFGNAIPNPIPEPAGLGLMGLLLLAARKRRS